jgi:acyl-CoA thioesterase I
MHWLLFHILSGHAFFTGVALVLVGAFASTRSRPISQRIAVWAVLVGVVSIVISSTPLPYWYYALAMVVILVWIASRFVTRLRRWAPLAVAAVALAAAVMELPHHIVPTLSPALSRSIAVIGDSVTAGAGDFDTTETWPRILAREHSLPVQDISHVGDTAASALKRARTHEIHASVVVVEIGGNDLLGSTPSARFARDLDLLLAHLASPDRQILMFELPLPPFYHEYGRIQRVMAKRHNVKLVPKRVFLSVLAGEDSTLDTIHLSQAGHQRMADCVWQLVRPAIPAEPR